MAGGADEDEAGALEVLAGLVTGEDSTGTLMLDDDAALVAGADVSGADVSGADVAGTDVAGTDVAGTDAEVAGGVTSGIVSVGREAVHVGVDAGALPVPGVTWICPSVYSLTGT